MSTTLPAFTPLEDSLYLTLCCRALDRRSPRPILGDALADEIVRELDYDIGHLHIDANLINTCALRAKRIDEVAADFVARHPDAVGLDLGAGLDTRSARIARPSTVDWYDVDFPAVAAARERVIPGHANPHAIGADLRDGDWLDAVPTGRPAVVVADGLMGFFTQQEMSSLLDRLISHFPSGEIAFNSYSRFAIWATKHVPGTKASPSCSSSPASTTPTSRSAGTLACTWSGRSCSAGTPRSPGSQRSCGCTTGCRRSARPGRARGRSSCTSGSSDRRGPLPGLRTARTVKRAAMPPGRRRPPTPVPGGTWTTCTPEPPPRAWTRRPSTA